MPNSVCFSGYRPCKYNFTADSKKIIYQKLIYEITACIRYGYDIYYFGGAPGFDLLAAYAVLYLKRVFDIKLICALPYENFYESAKFDESWRNDYFKVIEKCDNVINTSGKKEEEDNAYIGRNKFMIDSSNVLICLYNGKKGGTHSTVLYAQKKGIKIINILPL